MNINELKAARDALMYSRERAYIENSKRFNFTKSESLERDDGIQKIEKAITLLDQAISKMETVDLESLKQEVKGKFYPSITRQIEIAVDDTIDHLAPRIVREGWQPIGTAPKDGITKALYGCYKDGKWYTQITARGKGVGGIHVNVPTGFRSYTGATHWMPLPQPPASKED